MSTNDFLPWARRAAARRAAGSSRELPRRAFLKLAGIGGLVIAVGPGGARRIEAAESAPAWAPPA